MNSTIELIEQDEQYWPEFVLGFEADDDYEGDDDNNA